MEYNNVFKEDRGALSHGRFKASPQAIFFRNSKTGKVEQIKSEDIKEINWQRIALEYGIRISLKSGLFFRFGGFKEFDFEKLNKYCEDNYRINLKQKDICLKGFNWGIANFSGSLLSFDHQDKGTCFEIPLNNVSHCQSAKNEVTLEFHQNDDAPVSLMEIRFHIPTQTDGIDDPVQVFMDKVTEQASIIQATGESLCTFSELQCLTPRGRYDIKIFPTFIQLHGKTFDYKIPLTTILRLFRLPHKDQRQVFFVLSLDPPIKQGQTRYQFLILLFNKEEEISLEMNLTDELKDKYDGKLQSTMSGSIVDVLGQIMKVLVQRKITLPGIQGTSNQSITCSYKAAAGFLYPLEKGFIFIHKPPIHIRFDEIQFVNFARNEGSTKSFDFEVETKAGMVHTFNSIEKDEYSKLYDFAVTKKLPIKNRGTEKQTVAMDDDLVDSDMENEPDAYLERVKHEGKLRDQDDSEDDESEDEDFKPGEESDVEEEYDSEAAGSDSDDDSDDSSDSRKRKKKQSSKQEKPAKKSSSSKKSKKDDDDKPKKPQSAFFLWLNENRSNLKSKYPGLSLPEMSKKAGELWKEKTSEEKAVWDKKAAKAKEEYTEKMEEYNRKGGSSKGDKSSKKASTSKDTNKSPSKSTSKQQYKSKEFIDSSSESSSSSSAESSGNDSDSD